MLACPPGVGAASPPLGRASPVPVWGAAPPTYGAASLSNGWGAPAFSLWAAKPPTGGGRLRRPLGRASPVPYRHAMGSCAFYEWGSFAAKRAGCARRPIVGGYAAHRWRAASPPTGRGRLRRPIGRASPVPYRHVMGNAPPTNWAATLPNGRAAPAAPLWAAAPPTGGGRLRRPPKTRAITKVDPRRKFGENRFSR